MFEFMARDSDCHNDGEEDVYAVQHIRTHKPDPTTPEGRLSKVR